MSQPIATMRRRWRQKMVKEEKVNIKEALDQLEQKFGLDRKFEFMLSEIANLEDDESPRAGLRRFIFIVSALYHHQRFGGLSKKQISSLTDLSLALLKVNGIEPSKNQVSNLYGDLHSVLSQINLKSGDAFGAAWEKQLAIHLSTKNNEMMAINKLSMGLHSLRLGNADLALAYLNGIEGDVTPQIQEKIDIAKLRALRLSGNFDEALQLRSRGQNQDDSLGFRRELEWERLSIQASDSGDISALVASIKRRGSHYNPSYILEGFFWIHAVSSTRWFHSMPKLTSLMQYKELDFQSVPLFFQFARTIERAYDSNIPFTTRLHQLKSLLKKTKEIRNIDKELLIWLAATRWLHRNRYIDLAAVTFAEYRSISLRLSGGKSEDTLNLASDLLAINWTDRLVGA